MAGRDDALEGRDGISDDAQTLREALSTAGIVDIHGDVFHVACLEDKFFVDGDAAFETVSRNRNCPREVAGKHQEAKTCRDCRTTHLDAAAVDRNGG